MDKEKKIYFASDVHLGIHKDQSTRDKHNSVFISWLDMVQSDAEKIFLLGDIFDFWIEFRNVIPNSYGKVLSKLRELCDKGIEIHFFIGNHDMWTFGFLEKEIGLIIHTLPEKFTLYSKKMVLGHGHNLNMNDSLTLKIMNLCFGSKFVYKIATTIIHPDLIMSVGRKWSRHNRYRKAISHQFRGENESITKYCNMWFDNDSDVDYFVFGHLHTPTKYPLANNRSVLFILGEWIENPIYGTLNPNGEFTLSEWQ